MKDSQKFEQEQVTPLIKKEGLVKYIPAIPNHREINADPVTAAFNLITKFQLSTISLQPEPFYRNITAVDNGCNIQDNES